MKNWLSDKSHVGYNSYLRSISQDPKSNRGLTICMQSPQELQSALVQIQTFVRLMNTGKESREWAIEISLRVGVSKEMST